MTRLATPAPARRTEITWTDRDRWMAALNKTENSAMAIIVPTPKQARKSAALQGDEAMATGTRTMTAPVPANPCATPTANNERP